MSKIYSYHTRDAKPGEQCDECGKPAVIVIVADHPERDTGYVDEIAFCRECFEKTERV